MNDIKMIEEVDALQESIYQMREFERKYKISSKDFLEGKVVISNIDEDDLYLWEFYIQCYTECGGILEQQCNSICDDLLIEREKESVFTLENDELIALIVKGNKEKGAVKKLPIKNELRP